MNSFFQVCKSEFYKLRTQKSARILSVVAILFYPILTLFAIFIMKLASVMQITDNTNGVKTQFSELELMKSVGWSSITAGISVAGVLVAIFAIMFFSSEFQSGSIYSTLIATPNRIKLYFAKFVSLFIFTYLIAVIGEILAYLSSIPFLINVEGQNLLLTVSSADDFRYILGSPLMLAFMAVICLALGCLFRSTSAGIIIYFLFSFVLSAALAGIALSLSSANTLLARIFSGIQAFLPFSGSDAFLSNSTSDLSSSASAQLEYVFPLDHLQGFLVMLLWVIVLTFASLLLFEKRDIK
ncbi:MAG: ABC transporter permease [Bifidobacteriaceae bacterium]|jgi:ABC-type transport system involved in multi-copper enzyme maturation permease subunit|nr:ABC transporter permease [Bifidobacteriaceae bacterium]